MAHRDAHYHLTGPIEVDDIYFVTLTIGKTLGRDTPCAVIVVSLVLSADGHTRWVTLHPVPNELRSTI